MEKEDKFLRKRIIDECWLQKVRWRGKGARMLKKKGRRYTMWWSGKGDGVDCVGVMVKEELFEKVTEVRRVRDRVMAVVLIFGKDDVEVDLCVFSAKWKKFGR